MMGKLRALLKLSVHDWATLVHAWVLLLGVDIALCFLPFPKIQRFAAQIDADRPDNIDAPVIIHRLQRLVRIAASHHLCRMSCLRQALVLQRLLGRRGIPATLRIGVRLEKDDLDAHAWLEYAGTPIGQSSDVEDRYAILKPVKAK